MKNVFCVKKKLLPLLLILLANFYFSLLYADSGCGFKNIKNVDFGTYNPLSSNNDDSTGSIQVKCKDQFSSNAKDDYNLSLSEGSSNSYNPRTLKNGTQTLNYNLYIDAARTQVWGDGTSGTSIITGSGNDKINVYGRIFGNQDVAAGKYSDIIIATLKF